MQKKKIIINTTRAHVRLTQQVNVLGRVCAYKMLQRVFEIFDLLTQLDAAGSDDCRLGDRGKCGQQKYHSVTHVVYAYLRVAWYNYYCYFNYIIIIERRKRTTDKQCEKRRARRTLYRRSHRVFRRESIYVCVQEENISGVRKCTRTRLRINELISLSRVIFDFRQ